MAENANRVFTSKIAAMITPAAIIGIFGYVSWVVVALIALNTFLLATPRREDVAIGILVVYFLLLFMLLFCWIRLLVLTATKSGYVTQHHEPGDPDTPTDMDHERLCDYAQREIFVCNGDGKPRWCKKCYVYKSERAHHSSDVNRCSHKMDHFCPWVGGILCANTYKFFVQFTFYTTLYCAFVLAWSAYATNITSPLNPHFVVLIALSAFFGLFAGIMTWGCLRSIKHNCTQVELETYDEKVYTLAVHLPHGITPELKEVPGLRFITYPLIPTRTVPPRDFALINLPAGTNPFDLGWRRNMRSVLGDSVLDWLLPIRFSPCAMERQNEWAEPPYSDVLLKAVKRAGLTV